jgi:hypothetical protein
VSECFEDIGIFFRARNDIGRGASSRVLIPRSGGMMHANKRGACMCVQLHPTESEAV